MGFWSALGKIGKIAAPIVAAPFTGGASLATLPGILGAAGAGLGAISQGQASNRGEKFGGQLDLQNLLMQRDQQQFGNQIAREQEGRTSGQDAWRRLLAAEHTLSPATHTQLAGKYSVAPREATSAERTGAQAMSDEVMARLQGGNPIQPFQQSPMTVDPKLLDPGWFERVSGYASPVLAGLSRIQPRSSGGNI